MNHLHRLFAQRVMNLLVGVCICPKLNSYKWFCQFKRLWKCIALCSRMFSAVVIYTLFLENKQQLSAFCWVHSFGKQSIREKCITILITNITVEHVVALIFPRVCMWKVWSGCELLFIFRFSETTQGMHFGLLAC